MATPQHFTTTASDQHEALISIPAPRTEQSQAGLASEATTTPRLLLRVEEAAERLAISRTLMFAYLKSGAIESIKVGRLRRVPADALTAFIGRLTADQATAAA